MSQENVEIVRKSLEALLREDWDAAVADISPTAEAHDHDIPDSDVYIGPDGFLNWISQWGESFDPWTMEDLEFRPAPENRVVALFRMRATGRASGVEVERLDGLTYTLAEGSIIRMDYFNEQRQAIEAAGLSD